MTMLPADLHELRGDLHGAATRIARRARRRHRAFVAVSVLAVVGACGGVALAMANLLGSPAPRGVQTDLHRAVSYAVVAHPGLRLQTAKVVATSPAATLYSIADNHGNYCAELVGLAHGLIFGFDCAYTQQAPSGQLQSSGGAIGPSYVVAADGTPPPVIEFGRLPPHTVSARATYDNGAQEAITTGLGGFFVYQPSPRLQALARRIPMTLEFLDGHGAIWSYYLQPPQPLRLTGEHHISGRVVIDHASQVEIDVASRPGAATTRVYVPLHADGTFAWTGRTGSVVYHLTVLNPEGEPVSADTAVLTPKVVHQISALAE
jgi:hypothetical protein